MTEPAGSQPGWAVPKAGLGPEGNGTQPGLAGSTAGLARRGTATENGDGGERLRRGGSKGKREGGASALGAHQENSGEVGDGGVRSTATKFGGGAASGAETRWHGGGDTRPPASIPRGVEVEWTTAELLVPLDLDGRLSGDGDEHNKGGGHGGPWGEREG